MVAWLTSVVLSGTLASTATGRVIVTFAPGASVATFQCSGLVSLKPAAGEAVALPAV